MKIFYVFLLTIRNIYIYLHHSSLKLFLLFIALNGVHLTV